MSRARAKGTTFERLLLDPLSILWPEVERTGSAAFGDGDLRGTGPYTIEAKAVKEMKLSEFVDQATAAAQRRGTLPVVIVKRRRKPVTDAYVVMPLWAWIAAHQKGAPDAGRD